MDRDKFAETYYGHMQKILLHRIVNIQENYPTVRTIIRKDDSKSAHRKKHLSEQAAIQLATNINWKGTFYVLISLRLNFGGANRPVKRSTTAKPIADLGNALLLEKTW